MDKNRDLKNDFVDNEPIMDSVYGVINISPFEKRIISTKEMQRLRGIKQLGFVNLVYPDAEHSRFSHSIGVCHQSKIMIGHIETNLKNSSRYKVWRNKFKKDFNENVEISHVEKIVISASALLHDLPHSPFSHEIETPNIDGKGIPVHDDFDNNPVFFNYLFDEKKSDLAQIIDIYNNSFLELLKNDKNWNDILNDERIDNNGQIEVRENGEILAGKINKKLPLLGVMIFELLLFDKVKKWLDIDEKGTVLPNRKGVKVKINKNQEIIWKPIEGWFRPYRKDIVANTICSDLIDYLVRDGKNTGIIPSLDLKFFDRMTIAKAIPDTTNTLVPLDKIHDYCEHVVFDIYDHKRGVIRQSVITEIVSFLQQRYLLAERVYNHRVVEGARSMLQEASYLLVSSDSINIENLHDTNKGGSPINDDSFLSWVLEIEPKNKKEIIDAQHLVKMIQSRRIYRELVIIDGISGQHNGSFRGNDVNCKTLADKLLDYNIRNEIIKKLTERTAKYCEKENVNFEIKDNSPIFTIGVRKYGKRYKVPKVLVARPITNMQEHDIETFPLFEGKKLPSINDRLESMQIAYNSLWKVFLFIHPFFHYKNFSNLHHELAKLFISELYNKTNIKWENSIENYTDLLPDEPIDIPTFINKNLIYKQEFKNKNIVKKIITEINLKIPEDAKDFKLKSTDSQVNFIIREINKKPKIVKLLNQTKEADLKSLFSSIDFKLGEAADDQAENNIVQQIIEHLESNGQGKLEF